MNDENNPLLLQNNLCFALYVCSKEIVRMYKPLLDPLQLTYTEYITLMALWEKDNVTVKELGNQLYLDSGTLTPLLKKMERQKLLSRIRSKEDERIVRIILSDKGKELETKCASFPSKMLCTSKLSEIRAPELLNELHGIMNNLRLITE